MYSDTNKEISVTTTRGFWEINWGAVFAGLVFIYALSWLLFTLSSAIGLSIIEIPNPHDTNIESESLVVNIALYAWIIVTIGITYFLGGWLAGELSGSTNEIAVLLHAVVVWSCTIVIAVLLATIGVNSLFSSAASALKTTATAGMNLPRTISSSSGDGALSQLPSSFQPLIASLKQGIKKANSEQKNSSSSQNDGNDSRRENDSIQVSNDSPQKSTSSIRDSSKNNDDSSSENSNNSQEESFNQENSSSSQGDENMSQRGNVSTEELNSSTRDSSENNHGSTSKNIYNTQEANSNKKESRYTHRNHHSADRIDSQALSLIAVALIQGDVKLAKELFTSNTELDEKQVDELINSVKQKAEKLGNEIEKKANEAREYASGILWLIFISYILALIASILGARFGVRNLSLPVVQHTK